MMLFMRYARLSGIPAVNCGSQSLNLKEIMRFHGWHGFYPILIPIRMTS